MAETEQKLFYKKFKHIKLLHSFKFHKIQLFIKLENAINSKKKLNQFVYYNLFFYNLNIVFKYNI